MSLPLHNGALAVVEMQFPGKIMQGLCVRRDGGSGIRGRGQLCSSEEEEKKANEDRDAGGWGGVQAKEV